MRIHLIAPTKNGETYLFDKGLLAPLGLMYLAAHTPADVDVRIIDESVEPIDFTDVPDVVGITSMTATAPRAYDIADRYRSRGATVVMGGIHASMLPEEALEHADAVVVGEAEQLWEKVVEDASAGRLQPLYRQEEFEDFKNPRLPRRDLINTKRYWSANSVQTSRGCPHHCNFCSVTEFNGRKIRMRETDSVLAEVETLTRGNIMRKKVVPFIDDNIAANPKRAKELFKALIPMKLAWGSQASITIARDEELVALAAESGCRFLFVGLETLSPGSLAEMGKSQNKVEEYADALVLLKKYKIPIMGAFVFGFDGDDDSTFRETLDFAIKNKIQVAQFANLTPYPGTRLYEQLHDEKRLLDPQYWRDPEWDSHALFQPMKMMPQQLFDNTHQLHLDFYSYRSILKRMTFRGHWPYWLAFNLLYRQTVVSARTQSLAVPDPSMEPSA
ncbi:MAG: B12-binding domain-containing radical SAM protein [Candidatus Geothermincolia bacterium]